MLIIKPYTPPLDFKDYKIIKRLGALPESTLLGSFFVSVLLPDNLKAKFEDRLSGNKALWKKHLTLNSKAKATIGNLMRLYILFYLILLNQIDQRVLAEYKKEYIKKINVGLGEYKKVFNLTIFNYFNNNYFKSFYFNNIYIQKITKSYVLDTNYNTTFINSYNFYVVSQLKILEVLLNFEDYKYEEDKFRYKQHKYAPEVILYVKTTRGSKILVRRYKKMHTDFFDYIKKKRRHRFYTKYNKKVEWIIEAPWNFVERGEDDEEEIKKKKKINNIKNHVQWNHNLFFGYIVHDFAINLILNINNKTKFLFNYFNFDFFDKIATYFEDKMYIEEEKKKINNKYPYTLTSLYYNYDINNISVKAKALINTNTVVKKVLYTDYKNLDFEENVDFNSKKHILDIKYYGLKIHYIHFFLYTWYFIYYRRARYNYYIRGNVFFQEHFTKIQYFIWINNVIPAGTVKSKMTAYQIHKLFTIYHFKSYVEMAMFNDWYYFYYKFNSKLTSYINLDSVQHQFNFKLLLNNNYFKTLLNVLNEDNYDNKEFYNYSFKYKYYFSSLYHFGYERHMAYSFFIKTPVVRYEPEFKLGRLGYTKLHNMLETIYMIPLDNKRLTIYLTRTVLWDHFFNLYSSLNFLNIYFLKDLFNINNIAEYIKYFKILNFYEKIFYVVFLLIDPFFQKYFWKRCFPKKTYKLAFLRNFFLINIVMYGFVMSTKSIKFNIPVYDFFMHYLNWKIDTGNFHIVNSKQNTDKMTLDYITINFMYKQRFTEVIKQIMCLINKVTKIDTSFNFYYHYWLTINKNLYFDLLINNIEYILILFFWHKNKFVNLLNMVASKNPFIKFLYSNYIYRYYIYSILLETRYYEDWFDNSKKRVLWIYKNFLDHEGHLFYKNRNETI